MPAGIVAAVLVVSVVASAMFTHTMAGAAEPDPPLPDDPRLAPGLAQVQVDSPAFRDALSRYRGAEDRLTDARRRYADDQSQLADLTSAQARVTEQVNDATRRRDKSERLLVLGRTALGQVAVASYVRAGMGDPIGTGVDLESLTDRHRGRVMLETVNSNQLAQVQANLDVVDRTSAVLASAGGELDDLNARLVATTAARDRAVADGKVAHADIARVEGELSDTRLEAQVVGLGTGDGREPGIGFQLVALDAYVKAASALRAVRPQCGLRWQVLAGIGRVESAHGTYLGRHLAHDGKVSEDIIGIPLDGNNGTALITDTDGGTIDGDTTYDRAVGPMAFIPSAWRSYGRDGNGDGRADPQNMYDAALAAATLLCARGTALDTEAGLRRAAFGYNQSKDYVDKVVGFVQRYDAFTIPAGPT